MDTSNYDTRMAELRAAAQNGQLTKEVVDKIVRPGRPKGPEKVVYKRNVEPSMVPTLDAIVKGGQIGDSKPKEAYKIGEEDKEPSEEIKAQIKALLEDVEAKEQTIKNQEEKIQRIARLTDNEKLILWIRKYDQLEAAFKELQFRMEGLQD